MKKADALACLHFQLEGETVLWKETQQPVEWKRRSDGRFYYWVPQATIYRYRAKWVLAYGTSPVSIDHINGDGSDDRLENLRAATPSQQNMNRGARRGSRTGLRGVEYNSRSGRQKCYAARICKEGKRKTLGYFATAEEAHECYQKAARQWFGEFAKEAV